MSLVDNQNARQEAFRNILNALNFDIFLPTRIFKTGWGNFLFFPSDHMFTDKFTVIMSELLHFENAHVSCLLNINLTDSFEFNKIASIFLDNKVTGKDFYNQLIDGGPSTGWLYRVDAYACASNIGEWCIYCDRENDIAVIGFRDNCELRRFKLVLEKLFAKSIAELLTGDTSIFPFNNLTPVWRSELTKNYS